MKPRSTYVASAGLFSFSTAALVGYPAAAVLSSPGFAPNFGLWFSIILVLGSALTAYSAIPKPSLLLKLNWLVVPVVCIAMYLGCWSVNPKAVLDNTGMVMLFSIFTFGSPFWLPLGGLVLHSISCGNVKDQLGEAPMPNPSINTDAAR